METLRIEFKCVHSNCSYSFIEAAAAAAAAVVVVVIVVVVVVVDSKVADRCREQPEGSLFNSYYIEV